MKVSPIKAQPSPYVQEGLCLDSGGFWPERTGGGGDARSKRLPNSSDVKQHCWMTACRVRWPDEFCQPVNNGLRTFVTHFFDIEHRKFNHLARLGSQQCKGDMMLHASVAWAPTPTDPRYRCLAFPAVSLRQILPTCAHASSVPSSSSARLPALVFELVEGLVRGSVTVVSCAAASSPNPHSACEAKWRRRAKAHGLARDGRTKPSHVDGSSFVVSDARVSLMPGFERW